MDEEEKLKDISKKLDKAAYSLDDIFKDFIVIGSVHESLSSKTITGASHISKGNMQDLGNSILLAMREDEKIRLLLNTCVNEYCKFNEFMNKQGRKANVIKRKIDIKP